MNNRPLVSVIIPFYKNIDWLDQALQSVENQTYKNLEVLVINDGSPENCEDLIHKFSSFNFYKTKNQGAGAARNFGIELSTGDFVCFLDSDDLWRPQKVELQLDFMLKKNYKWSHTNYTLFQNANPGNTTDVDGNLEGNIIPLLFISSPIATPCVMVHGETLRNSSVLRFSPTLKAGEDSFLWLQLAKKHKLGLLKVSLTDVRLRGTNAARNAFLQLQSKAQGRIYVKESKAFFSNNLQYWSVYLGFTIALISYNILLNLSQKSTFINSNKEKVALFFYALPYLYLKFISKFLTIKKY